MPRLETVGSSSRTGLAAAELHMGDSEQRRIWPASPAAIAIEPNALFFGARRFEPRPLPIAFL